MKLIYAIQHNKTKRIYVGCTGNAGRINSHLSSAKNLKHHVPLINEDTEKYGLDFTVYVLEIIQPRYEWEARDAERKWMHYFNTCDPKCGYNYLDVWASKRSIESFPVYSEDAWRNISNISTLFKAKEKPRKKKKFDRRYKVFESAVKDKGITVSDVARETGIDRSSFSHWKAGRYTPKVESLTKIAQALDIPLSKFIE